MTASILIVTGDAAESLEVLSPYQRLREEGYNVHVDPGQYSALVIPGGRAPEYLRDDAELRKILKAFFDADKPVAQICHGPLLTASVGGLRGRRVTAYPALEQDMEAAGTTFQDSEAMVDGTLVSSRAWPDHSGWMREFLTVPRAKAPVS
ncbi:DJ-1/PfpI family protein [Streptomyces sp. NPDC054796]